MKHFIAFLFAVSTGLICLSTVNGTPPEITVRALATKELGELINAAVPNPLPKNCSTEMYTKLRQIKEAVGLGSLLNSIKLTQPMKGIDSISSANHFLLILGPFGNGLTAAIGFLHFLMSSGLKPKVTVALPREFLVIDTKANDPKPNLKKKFEPILKLIKELVGADKYEEFQETKDDNPTEKILARIIQTEKTTAIDGLTGVGKAGDFVETLKEFGMKLGETLIKNPKVLFIGHDGRSNFGSKFTDETKADKKGDAVTKADIVFNTNRAQNDQTSEALVLLKELNDLLQTKKDEPRFNVPYDTACTIRIVLVSLIDNFDYNLLNDMFTDTSALQKVFDAIKCEFSDHKN